MRKLKVSMKMEGLEGTHTTDLWEEILLEEASAAVDADEDSEVRDYGILAIFYTKSFTRKVVLWYFFTSEKLHNSTFQVKISV